ncbi:MAG: Na+/H+ antiporter subunit E [Alphaproteobacteria bacterium]|nr:Na+/H+ antiporter subunit E [Alphaproteobacteria bacterium]
MDRETLERIYTPIRHAGHRLKTWALMAAWGACWVWFNIIEKTVISVWNVSVLFYLRIIKPTIATSLMLSRYLWKNIILVMLNFAARYLLKLWRHPRFQRVFRIATWIAVLFGTWFILSGHKTPVMLLAGFVTSLLATRVLYRLNQTFDQPLDHGLSYKIFAYSRWLLKSIILSAWDVTWRVWQIKPSICPQMEWVPANQKTHLGLAIFGNSITLTPGTVTIAVQPGRLLVHSLTKEGMDDLVEGTMNRKIEMMGG